MYEKDLKTDPIILFADPPKLSDLCALDVSVHKLTEAAPSAAKFQPQIIRCRELIFTEPEIIGTPAFNMPNTFHIILQESKPKPVTPALYQSCLRYTLTARIAPNWNKAGEWLVQGRDFLTTSGYANVVKLDLTVNTNEMFLALEATTVRFPSLKLCDLDICPGSYQKFKTDPKALIGQSAICSSWCHVLPSMKKGMIVSISHDLPGDGPFQSYKDIKRHWKNTVSVEGFTQTADVVFGLIVPCDVEEKPLSYSDFRISYGYRLPESDEDVIYYQIHFRPLGERLFTYPECCLRSHDIQRLPRIDPIPIITSFLKDLQSKLPNICGCPLRLQNKAKCTVTGLCSSGQIADISVPQNLGNRKQENKANFRSRENIQQLLCKKPNTPKNPMNVVSNQGSLFGVQTSKTLQFGTSCSDINRKDLTASDRGQKDIQNFSSKCVVSDTFGDKLGTLSNVNMCVNSQGSQPRVMTSQPAPCLTITPATGSGVPLQHLKAPVDSSQSMYKVVPRFAPKTFIHKTPSQSQCVSSSSVKIIPVFKVRKPSSNNENISGNCLQQNKIISSLSIPGVELCNPDENIAPELNKVPSFNTNVPVFSKPKTTMKVMMSSKEKLSKSTPKLNELKEKTANSSMVKSTMSNGPSLPAVPRINYYSSHHGVIGSSNKEAALESSKVQSQVITSTQNLTPKVPPSKRPLSQSSQGESEQKPKKPRSKPQVQTNLDIEELAKTGQLNKANTITLISWLKERGIICKTKDKKGDIQDRVRGTLNLLIPEQ